MNRQEAAREIDNTACCFSDKRFRDAMHMAADALRGPQPDPITGLVPCGCGGKPRLYGAYDGLKVIQCRECGVSTLYIRPDNVQVIIDDWNAAMGYKGGAE